jgi:hypothetical protein
VTLPAIVVEGNATLDVAIDLKPAVVDELEPGDTFHVSEFDVPESFSLNISF